MIKDLNGLTVLMLVVTILAAIFLAWLYTKPGKKWLDELCYRRGRACARPTYLGRPTDHHSLCFSPPSSRSLLNHRSGS